MASGLAGSRGLEGHASSLCLCVSFVFLSLSLPPSFSSSISFSFSPHTVHGRHWELQAFTFLKTHDPTPRENECFSGTFEESPQ